jgi:hypothetical protein
MPFEQTASNRKQSEVCMLCSTTVLQTAFQIVARALSPAASALKPTPVLGLPTWVEMSLDPAGRVPNAI